MTSKKKYPIGIQEFESLRKDGYYYVDKTPIIYSMITEGKPYFLSRPRRFGKSLLCSTLEAVFQGRRDLFEKFTTEEGIEQPQLYIATTNWKWEKHPIFRFDFSKTKEYSLSSLEEQIDQTLSDYEVQYGMPTSKLSSGLRFEAIVKEAHRQTGRRAVVIVDEYDTFMLHNIGNPELEKSVRQKFSTLFSVLKPLDGHLQFVFITGISKFSQMGIFSGLNHLLNISMTPKYETICGISEEELVTQFHDDIVLLGEANGLDYEQQMEELKETYDGYHFSERMCDMYNPFSLLNAFETQKIDNYWFDRGTSSSLIDILAQMPDIDFAEIENVRVPSTAFDLPLESLDDPLPVLYQSGYLTIKDYVKRRGIYVLGFPNNEVRKGFADCLFKHVAGKKINTRQTSALLDAYYDFYDTDDLTTFIEAIKTFYASVPYHLDNQNEHHYHALLYTLLTSFGADVRAEEPTAKGRADIVLRMPLGIYIIEIKYDSTAAEALEQINQKGYADKYLIEGRPITKVGIAFSSQERNIIEWEKEK